MTRNGARPRRLRVSALAAVANPSYTRIDTWNLLDDACRQPRRGRPRRAGQGPRPGSGEATDGPHRRLRAVLAVSRCARIWRPSAPTWRAFPRCGSAEEVSLAVRLLSEYGDRTALFDTSAPLADQELVAQAKQQQFYTVLLADDSPSTAPDCLAESLRALRNPSDDVQFEVLVAPSVEDAITAVALNGEIQAAIIRHDLPLRSRDRVPLMNTLLGASDDAVEARRRPGLGRMRRVDQGVAAAYRPLPAHRRVDRGGQRRRSPTSTIGRSIGSTTSPICTAR